MGRYRINSTVRESVSKHAGVEDIVVPFKDRKALNDWLYKYPNLNFYTTIPEPNTLTPDQLNEIITELSSLAAFPNFSILAQSIPSLLFYRDEHHLPVKATNLLINSYCLLDEYVKNYGSREVNITEPISFLIRRAISFANVKKILIKPFSGVQKTNIESIPNQERMKKWFLRPESLFYKEFNQKIILDFSDETNTTRVSKLLDVYDKREWKGYLNDLHPNLPDIDNRFITQDFDDFRFKCSQKCYATKSCQYCPTLYTTWQTLSTNKNKTTNREL